MTRARGLRATYGIAPWVVSARAPAGLDYAFFKLVRPVAYVLAGVDVLVRGRDVWRAARLLVHRVGRRAY